MNKVFHSIKDFNAVGVDYIWWPKMSTYVECFIAQNATDSSLFSNELSQYKTHIYFPLETLSIFVKKQVPCETGRDIERYTVVDCQCQYVFHDARRISTEIMYKSSYGIYSNLT